MTARSELTELIDRLEAQGGGVVVRDAPSARLTTYRCGGALAALVTVTDTAQLDAFAAIVASAPEVAVLVIGRGSNLLVADEGFAGVGLVLADTFERVDLDAATGNVVAGGAVALPVLARRTAAAGLTGLEFFVGIPGSVGGAVRMNAGGHGSETRDVVVAADVLDLRAAVTSPRPRADLGLGYRHSALDPRSVVVRATFAATPDDAEACTDRIDEIVRWRREHQPGGQNAGSVFTNPPGDSAGRLIDTAGLKGLRIGGAVVSEKHANFFVADPDARAADVHALVIEVRKQVAESTGVVLEPELQLVGFANETEGVGR